jgi:hypothetical protein
VPEAEHTHERNAIGNQAEMQRRFFLMVGYLLILPVLVYPALFIVIQDFPDISDFSLRRYVDFAANPNELKSHVTGLVFSLVFVSGFAALFVRPATLRFAAIGTVLMTLAYYPMALLTSFSFDIGAAVPTIPLIQGWNYFLAAGLAISVSLGIMRRLAGRETGEPVAGRSSLAAILWLPSAFVLLGFTLAYPYATLSLVVLLAEGRTSIGRLFEPLEIAFSSLIFQAGAVVTIVGYLSIVSLCFFRSGRLKFTLLSSAVCYFLFFLLTYGAVALHLKVSTAEMTTGCRLLSNWSSCLSIAEYSWVFMASASISILTANLLARYQADPPLYRF